MADLTERERTRLLRLRANINAAAERERARFVDELRRLGDAGHTQGEIAAALGTTRQAVHDLLRRADADPTPVARDTRRSSA